MKIQSILLGTATILAILFFALLFGFGIVAPFIFPITDGADLFIAMLLFISCLALFLILCSFTYHLYKSK